MEDTTKLVDDRPLRVLMISHINDAHVILFNVHIEPNDFDRLYDMEIEKLHALAVAISNDALSVLHGAD